MKRKRLGRLLFMALCCDLGIVTKKLIAPAANILTDALHIPGGIGTGFSLMFLVIAASLIGRFGCGMLMGAVQSLVALALGSVGSMGALSPIGYIVPGLLIDIVLYMGRKFDWDGGLSIFLANILASVSAALTANIIVFRLRGIVLLLYLSVSLTTGAVCGALGGYLTRHLRRLTIFQDLKG